MNYIIGLLLAALIGYFLWEEYGQIKKNNVVRVLIERYAKDVENPELIDKIYDFVSHDRKLGKIVAKYQATRDDFDRLFHRLLPYGNFRKINRFVPINSFFYVNSLTTLLRDGDKLDDLALTHKMFNYFHI